MATLNHVCEDCNSEFTIKYDEDICEDDPIYCPFCSSYILLESDELQDDDD
jgi:DNA-directed RNA polymerase subunit RPC12/RpoP